MKKFIALSLLCCFYTSLYAQDHISFVKKEKPESIYTLNYSDFINEPNSFTAINNRLKLANIDFRHIDFILVASEKIDNSIFSSTIKSSRKNPRAYNFDDYTDYKDYTFRKEFLNQNDPTLWEACRFLAPDFSLD